MEMKKIIVALLSVCFAISVHAQYAWKNLPIGGGGYVTGLVVHPQNANIMYARTDVGGAYKWDTAGEKWIPITEMFTAAQRPYYSIDGIAIDPKNQSVVYICAGNGKGPSGILKSTDYGASWTLLKSVTFIGNGSKRWIGEPIQVDPNNSNVIYCGTRNSGLLQSSDGGATWTKITSVPLSKEQTQNMVQWILKNAAQTDVTYYRGVQGSFRMSVPAASKQKGAFVLTATYTDHGAKDGPKGALTGQDVVVVKVK